MNLSLLWQVLAERKKAIAAFVATWAVALVAKYVPWISVDVDFVETAIVAVITAITVHQVPNQPKVG
jgi:hypothetical protein